MLWVFAVGFSELSVKIRCMGKHIALSVHSKLARWKMVGAAGIKVSTWERLYLPFFPASNTKLVYSRVCSKDRSRSLIFLKKKVSNLFCSVFLNKFLNALIGLSVDLKPSCWNQRLLADSELLLHYSESRCLGPRDEHKSTSWNIYMKLAGWCNEVSCIFPTTRLRKAPSSSF